MKKRFLSSIIALTIALSGSAVFTQTSVYAQEATSTQKLAVSDITLSSSYGSVGTDSSGNIWWGCSLSKDEYQSFLVNVRDVTDNVIIGTINEETTSTSTKRTFEKGHRYKIWVGVKLNDGTVRTIDIVYQNCN